MLNDCPNCEKLFDFDGFWEHGDPTLYLCGCGTILREEKMQLIVVPEKEVDLLGLEDQRNLYIRKDRWKNFETTREEDLKRFRR
jgi:hypothetical protein